jgi:hypothetical protein
MSGCFSRSFPHLGQQLCNRLEEPLAVGEYGQVHPMIRVGIFGDSIEERAAPEARDLDPLCDGRAEGVRCRQLRSEGCVSLVGFGSVRLLR